MSGDAAIGEEPAGSRAASVGAEVPSRVQLRILLLACGLCYLAQSFRAWGWPAIEGYPAIERWLDPGFLTADFFTNTVSGYRMDTWQGVLFGSIQRWTGVPYTVQIAILTALRLLAWPWVLFGFLSALLRNRTAAAAGVVLGILGDFALPRTLGWAWLSGDGSATHFATFIVTGAWTLLLVRRAWAGALLLAVAALIQPLVAVHGAVMAAAILTVDYSADDRRRAIASPATLIAAGLFAAVLAWQYVSLIPPPGERLPVAEYVRIVAWERNPEDYLPSRFPLDGRRAFAIACFAVVLMIARLWPRLERRVLIVTALAVCAAIGVAGYLFVELWPVRLVIDLAPFGIVIVAAPLMLAVMAAFAAGALRSGLWITLTGLGLAFILAGPYGQRLGVNPLIPATLLLAVAALGKTHRESDDPAVAGGVFWRLAIVVLAALAIPAVVIRREVMVLPGPAIQHPLYAWAKQATPANARFLVEQFSSDPAYEQEINPQRMRLLGRRAVAASKELPVGDDAHLRSWLRTWVVGLDHGAQDRVETADVATLRRLCRDLPYDYVVRANPLPATPGILEAAHFEPARGVGRLYVYRTCTGAS